MVTDTRSSPKGPQPCLEASARISEGVEEKLQTAAPSNFSIIWIFTDCESSFMALLNLSSCVFCSALLLSFIFLFCLEEKKLSCCSQSLCSPPALPQHQSWLEGVAHFPESKVSQLTKNVSFLLRTRSPLTEMRNFLNSQTQDRQESRYGGSRDWSKER